MIIKYEKPHLVIDGVVLSLTEEGVFLPFMLCTEGFVARYDLKQKLYWVFKDELSKGFEKELHIKEVLGTDNYPTWFIIELSQFNILLRRGTVCVNSSGLCHSFDRAGHRSFPAERYAPLVYMDVPLLRKL